MVLLFDLALTALAVVQLFEVMSTITIKELRRSIAFKLNLSSAEGYGLYVKTQRKVKLNHI